MLLRPIRVASSRCKSSAVPSSCHTLADAKGLPPAVFVCDKKEEKVLDACDVTTETACDALAKCTWYAGHLDINIILVNFFV